MEQAVLELIEYLKGVSPFVWEAVIRQVYVEAWSKVFWSLAFCFAMFLLNQHLGKKQKESVDPSEFYGDNDWAVWVRIGSVITGFLSLAYLSNAIKWLANPEFYAIRYIIEKVTGS